MAKQKKINYFYALFKYKVYLLTVSFLIGGAICYLVGISLESKKKYTVLFSPEEADGNKKIELEENKDNAYSLSNFFLHLSTIFGAACVVDLIYRVGFFRASSKRDDSIKELLSEMELSFNSFTEHRILGVYSRLPLTTDIRQLIESSNHVVIVQTFIPDLIMFKEAVIKTFRTNPNFHLEIFLLCPTSILAKSRSEVIAPDPNTEIDPNSVTEDIKGNLKYLHNIANSLKAEQLSRFHLYVYEYDLLPSASIYKFDDIAYIGFYMYGDKAVDTPQIKVDCTKGVGLRFMEQLDYLRKYENGKVMLTDYFNEDNTKLIKPINHLEKPIINITKAINGRKNYGKKNRHKRNH
ncbi:MAG: hypothetical protein WC699_04750 [Bacteroidales bacterium]|jgi:hypothetical protein